MCQTDEQFVCVHACLPGALPPKLGCCDISCTRCRLLGRMFVHMLTSLLRDMLPLDRVDGSHVMHRQLALLKFYAQHIAARTRLRRAQTRLRIWS